MKTLSALFGFLVLASPAAWAQAVIPLTGGSGDTPRVGELAPVPGTDGTITSLDAAAADRIFIANLTGTAEVPPRQTNASGAVAVSLNPDGTSLHYRLAVTAIQDVTAAHLHMGLPGENGPIVVPLLGQGAPGDNTTLPEGVANGVIAEGDITAAELTGPLAGTPLAVFMELLRSGAIYANVHTSQYPDGEIRGQIRGIAPSLDALQLLEGMPGADDSAAGDEAAAGDEDAATPGIMPTTPGAAAPGATATTPGSPAG